MMQTRIQQKSLKLLTGAGVLLFALGFCLPVFSQNTAAPESKVTPAGDEMQIVYTLTVPAAGDPARIDEGLAEKTKEIVLGARNLWAQTYPVESVAAAEKLLGIDLLFRDPGEGYAPHPDKGDTLRVQADTEGRITGTTYTGYRTYQGYGVTLVAETLWEGSAPLERKYTFPFSQKQYTIEEIPFTMPWGQEVTAYEVMDKAGGLAGQYLMFSREATNYLVYLIPFAEEAQAAGTEGRAIGAVLRDWVGEA